jgi:high frequency lysogenization protein
VQGQGEHLATAETVAAIRALLFAAVRSAVLWRQSGGGRFKLFFYRRRYGERARARLRELGIPENDWSMPSP